MVRGMSRVPGLYPVSTSSSYSSPKTSKPFTDTGVILDAG